MVFEIFTRKRSPESSSSEPPRKSQNRGLRFANESRSHENASQRTSNDYNRLERSSAKTEYERRPSSLDARTNPFLRSLPRADEEDLEPPGTGSSTLQYTLTSRVSFLTWKDRLYRELEELNCLFTVEPSLKRKANLTPEDELTYRNLAKAVICMRLDDAHLALVDNLNDPLKVMKVLSDFREPELRHLEKRAQQRLDSTVYHATVPVRDFVRTFENLLNEMEKHSGERLADCTKKQHLLSAVVGEFPNIMAGSKTPSNEIRYDDLKKLLIQAVERQAAAKKGEEQRRAANRNGSVREQRGAAGQNVQVSEKQSAGKNIEMNGPHPAGGTAKVDAQRTATTNIALYQGLESRSATTKIEVNDQRSTGSTGGNNNISTKEHQCAVEDPRPAVKNTEANQRQATGSNVAAENADLNQRHLVGATVAVANRSLEENERHQTSRTPVDERPHAVKDAKGTEGRPSAKSIVEERFLPIGNAKAIDRHSVAKSDINEQPLSARDNKVIDRRSVASSSVDEWPLPARDSKVIDRHSVASSSVGEQPLPARDSKVIDRRSVASSNVDERPLPTRDNKVIDRHSVASSNVDERPLLARDSKMIDRRSVASSNVNERPLPARDSKMIDHRSVANSSVDERPLPARDSKVIDRRSVACSNVDERPLPARDSKMIDHRSVANSTVDERPLPARDSKVIDRRSVASLSVDERPLLARDSKVIDRHSVANSNVNERPLPARDSKVIDRHSIASSNVDKRPLPVQDTKVIDHRSIASSSVDERPLLARDVKGFDRRCVARLDVDERSLLAPDVKATDRHSIVRSNIDERPHSLRDARGNERRPFSTNAASRTEVDDPRPVHERHVAVANTVGVTAALYERRPPRPSAPKDELVEQVELDKRIQEQIESNPRLASSQVTCTKCGAFGHLVDDCKRKDNLRKCYNCLRFVNDHVASTCPKWGEYSTVPRFVQPRTNSKFIPESHKSKSSLPPSSPPFAHSYFPPEILEDEDEGEEEEEDDDDDLPLVDGLRQVYHIRRRLTTKKLKTGRIARKDLIFTDSDFYVDVEYREMFIEEDEEEPGDIILETIKVMSTNQK